MERRITDPTQLPTEMAAMPADPQSWPDWLGASAGRAAAAASDAALEAPVFNAAGDERTGGQFWLHSLLNEAVIHGSAPPQRQLGRPRPPLTATTSTQMSPPS